MRIAANLAGDDFKLVRCIRVQFPTVWARGNFQSSDSFKSSGKELDHVSLKRGRQFNGSNRELDSSWISCLSQHLLLDKGFNEGLDIFI